MCSRFSSEFFKQIEIKLDHPVAIGVAFEHTFIATGGLDIQAEGLCNMIGKRIKPESADLQFDADMSRIALGIFEPRGG